MAGLRPSDVLVTNLGTLAATDSIPIDRAGVDLAKKTTPADITTYVSNNHVHHGQTLEPNVVALQTDIATAPTAIGATYWDATYHTLATVTTADTTLQHGQEVVVWCKNRSGVNIANGDAVYTVSGTGATPTIAKADADIEASSYTLGVATQAIADNGEGFVTVIGNVNGICTNGSSVGESWAEGDILYLSSVAGQLTKTKPIPPKHGVYIATVTYAHVNNGTLFVRPTIGYELDELHDVLITSKSDGEALVYESSSGLWKNKPVASSYTLPIATASVLGGVKQGTGTSIDANGVISVTAVGTGDVIQNGTQTEDNFVAYHATSKNIKDSGKKASDFATANHNHTGVYDPAGTASSAITTHNADATHSHLSAAEKTVATQAASGTQNGYLSSSDWSTFNGKEPAITAGTTSQYLRGDKSLATFPTSMTPTAHASTHIADTGSDPLHAFDVNGMAYHGWLTRDMTMLTAPVTYGPLPQQITTTTFTLYGTRSTCIYYYQATKVTVTTNKTTVLNDGTAGLYYIYFDAATGNIANSKNFPGVYNTSNVLIATVTWNGTNLGWVNDERHGYMRNGVWHYYQHTHVGALYDSGIVLTTANSGAGLTFATTSGAIDDEDINFTVNASSAFPTPNTCKLIRQTGATTYLTEDTVSTKPFYWSGTLVQYVNPTNYALATTNSNRWINVWIYATTDLHTPIVAIAETPSATVHSSNGYTSVALARAINPPSLSDLTISHEMKILYRLIMTGAGTVAETTDYRNSSPLPAGGSASTSASAVSAIATTPETYVTVQGQLDNRPNYNVLGALSTGLLKVTTATGALSTAVNSDLPTMSATVGGAVPTPPNNTTTFLRGDGTFASPPVGGLTISTKTGDFTASSGNIYQCDTSGLSANMAVTLPTGTANSYLELWDFDGTWGTTNKGVTVTPATGEKINGQAANETLVLNVSNARVAFAYADSTRGWQLDIGSNSGGLGLTASGIINVSAGNISAVNVQSAINELDAEKCPVAGPGGSQSFACGAITERGRSFVMGEWVAPTFNAGNYTASNGTNWTVAAGDELVRAYTVIGKTLFVNLYLQTTTIANAPTYLIMGLFGYTVNRESASVININNGSWQAGLVRCYAGENTVRFYKDLTMGTTWTNNTDSTYIYATFSCEIQ